MPLLTNFVAAADVLAKVKSFEDFLENTFMVAPSPRPVNIADTAKALFGYYRQDLLIGNGDDFFEKMEWLEAYAWKKQEETDPVKQWLPSNGAPDVKLFMEYIEQHHVVAEEERGSAGEIPSLHDAVELVIKLEGHWLLEENRSARHKIPEFFYLLSCAEELYEMQS